MNSIQKMQEALKDNPEMQKKLYEDAVRLVQNKEADELDALARSVRENLDIEITRAELEAVSAKIRELDPEQLEQAAGGEASGAMRWGAIGCFGGLVTGTAIGTAICPGIGSIIGFMVGAGSGLVSGSLGGMFLSDE